MKRWWWPPSSPPLKFNSATNSAMSFRPTATYRGAGRNQSRRTFSNRPDGPHPNFRFRPNYDQGPPVRHPGPPPLPRGPPPQQFNQQFRPPQFYQNQQFQPRQRPARPPDYRNWEYAKSPPPPSRERFTVLSYNILADYLAINHRSKLYFHIPRYILDWEFRKKNILFELGLWSADILCLQEVDRYQELEEELKVRGYNGIWKMRTGDPVDGCAIFWRLSRFKLLHEESLEFSKLGLRDNVAQICVLESKGQNSNGGRSSVLASSDGGSKVVVCNIHVLYNPKRGEIKLGQVRVLLNRAHALSKRWDAAPVVLCGDFNCTPKSALYNFISEQKLNVSELPRDRISGQASAEIRSGRQFIPNASSNVDKLEVRETGARLDLRGKIGLDGNSVNVPFTSSFAETVISNPLSSSVGSLDNKLNNSERMETLQCKREICGDETESIPRCLHESPSADTVTGNIEDLRATSDSSFVSSDVCSQSSAGNEKVSGNTLSDENYSAGTTFQPDDVSTLNLNVSLSKSSHLAAEFSPENSGNMSSPLILDEAIEQLSLDEPSEESTMGGEDSKKFLSELHYTNDEDAICDSVDCTEFFEEPSGISVVLDDSSSTDFDPNLERPRYDPSAWTPMEIEAATGHSECTSMEHPIKLKSAYTEVEDFSGTRDEYGEPQVTSYHRGFSGTVDYIWCSEGLQTVRVLAPIPRHAMQWTPGFPTRKWGSDHIALVAEMAFTNDADASIAEQRD